MDDLAPVLAPLLAYAARIGRDPLLVQGAGGNVSAKGGGIAWVKASGTWLAQAEDRDILVPVRLAPMLDALETEAAEDAGRFVARELDRSGLRPSIEATLHAAMPHRVVVHVHCVDTIAWACLRDAEAALAGPLCGLAWCFVPYVRPGPPLTRSLLRRMRPGTDVAVLGNHGLAVGADTVAGAEALVAEVGHRLRRAARPAPAPDLAALRALASGTEYAPAADPVTHATALDPLRLAVARRGSLYPDHVVFLGPGISEAPGKAAIWVAPGAGVLLRRDASAGATALARCLADVSARLGPADDITALSSAEEAELLGWDAEKYRRALEPGATAGS